MKKIIQAVLILSLSLFLPGICTMLITGKTGGNQRKMGVIVTLENGDQIDGEDFVIGMAASELSYAREEEALKAWVIVCRTNFVKAVGDKKEVKAEDLSLDYISEDELEQNNGRKVWLELNNRLEEASEETFGQVLCYGGSLIDALYHPVSIGKTVSASEIYSVDVPYLISVDSSQDVESEEYMDVKIMSYKDCVKMLSDAGYTETEESCKNNLKIEKQTENGFVQSVKTKDNKWTGEEWKDIFSLNSTNFYLENYGDRLRIVTIGKGHSMGMSLYGANALAQKDLSAATILSYYYPGTELQDAFAGEKALQVTPGMIRFTTTSDGAIRVPLDRFNRFKIAVRSHNTTACWFGFRLIKPSDSSPVSQTKDLFYRVGYSQPGLAYLTLTPVKPKVDEWVEYERDLREDITGLWGEDWADAIVVSVFMGPVDRNSADYDNLIFMSDKYTGIESSKKKEEISVCFDDGGSRMIISGGTGQEGLWEIRLADMGGRICYEDRLRFGNGVLSCSIPPLSQGAYLLTISDVEQEGYHRLYASVVLR